MFKKVMVAGLIVSVSVQAVPGQELQVVMQTSVAQAIRWLSSGKPEANIAAGAVAASVVYSGACLITLPYRAWSAKAQKQEWARQLKEVSDKITISEKSSCMAENAKSDAKIGEISTALERLKAELAAVDETGKSRLTKVQEEVKNLRLLPQECQEKVFQRLDSVEGSYKYLDGSIQGYAEAFQAKNDTITGDLEQLKAQVQGLAQRLIAFEQKLQQPTASQVDGVVLSQDFGGRLTAVEGQVKDHTGQITSATKKINEASHLGQKVSDLEEKVTILVGQVAQLQNKVFPANTSK